MRDQSPSPLHDQFHEHGSFLCMDGMAKASGLKPSRVKVCFTATDQHLLREVLASLAKHEDCYGVKFSKNAKDGMYLGRCFFTSAEKAGKIWAEFKPHPKLMVNLQDDDFAAQFRDD